MNSTSQENTNKSQAFYYGFLGMPIAMLGLPIYIYLPSYYASEFAISLTTIGLALLLARIIDVFTDPLIGVWSDRVNTKISRQNQVVFGSIILALLIYPLFLPIINFNEQALGINTMGGVYLFVLSFLTYFAWTLIQVPYLAIAAETQSNSLQRRSMIAWREALTILGVLFMLLLPFILGYQVSEKIFYESFVVIFIVILMFATFVLKRSNKINRASLNKPLKHEAPISQPFQQIKLIKQQYPRALLLFPPYFLNNLANAIPATLFLIFVEQYLQLNEQAGVFLLVYFIAGIASLPLWLKLAKKIGRILIWRASILLSVLSFLLVFMLKPGDEELYFLICLLTGFSVAIDIALPASIQADISHEIEQKSENMHGLLFGIWGMLTKLSLAIAVGISLPAVDFLSSIDIELIANHDQNVGLLIVYALPAILIKTYVWFRLKQIQNQLGSVAI